MIVFKSKELIDKCYWLVNDVPTEYYDGDLWGQFNTSTGKWRMACNISIKMLLWGFKNDRSQLRGGCIYRSNGVPDWTCDGVLNYCTGVSQDFNKIIPGEVLNMKGSTSHVGIYLGDGKVFECTAAGSKKCLISTIDNNGNRYVGGKKNPYKWTYHGKMTQWIDYTDQDEKPVYEKIEPKQMIANKNKIDKWNLSFKSWSSAKSVKQYNNDIILLIVAKYKHKLGGTYYITDEDFEKNHYGINSVDLKDYVEPREDVNIIQVFIDLFNWIKSLFNK